MVLPCRLPVFWEGWNAFRDVEAAVRSETSENGLEMLRSERKEGILGGKD